MRLILCLLAGVSVAMAQSTGWRPVGGANPSTSSTSAAPAAIPAELNIKSGTYITVRLNQALSSDRNQSGDAFSVTLDQPIVVDGIVVAQRGETVAGQVVEAKKAGRIQGISHLGIQLTSLTLADGTQIPIQTQLITRNGRTSTGQDAAAIGTTTALGAAVGAAAGWGTGAAIGAGAGAGAGILGVLLTRGRPTILGPEALLTFRIESPVMVSTARAPQAFHYVSPDDYRQSAQIRASAPPYRPARPRIYYAPYPYYPYYGGPGFYGPRVFIGIHGRFRR